MTRRASISILFCSICVLTAQAQWNKQDSIRLQELLNGDGELKINTEAVKSIHFDFKPEKDKLKGTPIMSQDKPWMKFLKDLPKNFGDTTKWVRPKYVRLTPYTPYTKWNEDPFTRMLSQEEKDSLRHVKMFWKINVTPDPSRMNGHIPVPEGMDPTVTPSNSPLIGGFDTDKFLFETLTKRGRTFRRNRKHANAWKTYQDYIPTRQDTVKKDSILMMELLRRKSEELYPGTPATHGMNTDIPSAADSTLTAPTDNSQPVSTDTLDTRVAAPSLLENKINGKNQAKESR